VIRGPLLVILRSDELDAVDAAVTYLARIGAVNDDAEARVLIDQLEPQAVDVVVW
jgi:hypothetical protein